jgi:hypothetical protein
VPALRLRGQTPRHRHEETGARAARVAADHAAAHDPPVPLHRLRACVAAGHQPRHGAAGPRAKLTRTALRWALVGLVRQHLSVARLAEPLAVSWTTANSAVLAEGRRVLLDGPARFDNVHMIGVDEHVWRHTRRGDRFVTVVIDLTPVRARTGPSRLLAMVEGRVGAVSGVTSGWVETFEFAAAELPPDAEQADYAYTGPRAEVGRRTGGSGGSCACIRLTRVSLSARFPLRGPHRGAPHRVAVGGGSLELTAQTLCGGARVRSAAADTCAGGAPVRLSRRWRRRAAGVLCSTASR